MSSVELNTKLLRLYFQWPDRKKQDSVRTEAVELFKWLSAEHRESPEVQALDGVDDAEIFLKKNDKILHGQPLEVPVKQHNARIEPRIENDVQVVVTVDDCEENVELIGMASNGRTQDIGLHGMRISIDKRLPEGTILSLKIQTAEGDSFELLGESRWVQPLDDGHLMGLQLIESEGFEAWHSQFGLKFVAPKIGRNYTPEPAEQTPWWKKLFSFRA